MIRLTVRQHTALARLSDGEWRRGHEMEAHPSVIAALNNHRLIRGAKHGRFGVLTEDWTITPDGEAALRAGE